MGDSPRSCQPLVTMPPRVTAQTTLDAVFNVKPKRRAAEIAAASGSIPAEKRRKVSERYLLHGLCLSFLRCYRFTQFSNSEEVKTVVEAITEESIPSTGDEIVDSINNLEKDTMDEGWYKALQGEFKKPYFKSVSGHQFLLRQC